MREASCRVRSPYTMQPATRQNNASQSSVLSASPGWVPDKGAKKSSWALHSQQMARGKEWSPRHMAPVEALQPFTTIPSSPAEDSDITEQP